MRAMLIVSGKGWQGQPYGYGVWQMMFAQYVQSYRMPFRHQGMLKHGLQCVHKQLSGAHPRTAPSCSINII